jgi:transposase
MKERRIFTKDFKISVIREIENGKNAAQVCRENVIHPSLLYKWKQEYKECPQKAFRGHGNASKLDATVEEYERVIGQLYAENKFLKKTLSNLEIKLSEYRKIN